MPRRGSANSGISGTTERVEGDDNRTETNIRINVPKDILETLTQRYLASSNIPFLLPPLDLTSESENLITSLFDVVEEAKILLFIRSKSANIGIDIAQIVFPPSWSPSLLGLLYNSPGRLKSGGRFIHWLFVLISLAGFLQCRLVADNHDISISIFIDGNHHINIIK